MLSFMKGFKNFFEKFLLISLALFVALIVVGGLFFDLDAVVLASWFTIFYLGAFIIAFGITAVAFLIWFIFEAPSFLKLTLCVILAVVVAIIVFIATDIHFLSSVGDSVKDIFSFMDGLSSSENIFDYLLNLVKDLFTSAN